MRLGACRTQSRLRDTLEKQSPRISHADMMRMKALIFCLFPSRLSKTQNMKLLWDTERHRESGEATAKIICSFWWSWGHTRTKGNAKNKAPASSIFLHWILLASEVLVLLEPSNLVSALGRGQLSTFCAKKSVESKLRKCTGLTLFGYKRVWNSSNRHDSNWNENLNR